MGNRPSGGREKSVPTSVLCLIAIRFTLHPIVVVGASPVDIATVVAHRIVPAHTAVVARAGSVDSSIVARLADRSAAAGWIDTPADRTHKAVHSDSDRLAAAPVAAMVDSRDTVAALDLPDSSY